MSVGREEPRPPAERSGGVRRLGTPRRVKIRARRDGLPASVGGAGVEAVLEEWLVEDRWWTGDPLRRRYAELVMRDGRNVVVFQDLGSGAWFLQRA